MPDQQPYAGEGDLDSRFALLDNAEEFDRAADVLFMAGLYPAAVALLRHHAGITRTAGQRGLDG